MFESLKKFFTRLIERLFGTKFERDMKRIQPLVDAINANAEGYQDLTDEELKAKTPEFRERIEAGETVDDLLPEAFAVVKEACRRHVGKTWNVVGQPISWQMVPYDVQLVGSIVLHEGKIAEMATGEGKTLVALMPLYLNALPGKGAHLITVNEYLAQRDREWVGAILEWLGLRLDVIKHEMTPPQRREAYGADVTYGTNNEFGFDYLRDNMAVRKEDQVQRQHHYVIVDEVDNVLIDEARTPLIISGPVTKSNDNYSDMRPMVDRVVRLQQGLVNNLIRDVEKELSDGEDEDVSYETAVKLLQIQRAAPKNKRFIKLTSDRPGLAKNIRKTEFEANRDKRMGELDEDLYYTIDEKTRDTDLTDKGRHALAPNNPDMFILPDLSEEIEAIEANEEIDPTDRVAEKEKAFLRYAQRADTVHALMQLLKAYSLYEKDVEYVVQDGKVVIVDEFTGRLMHGRRWSDGLHQAVEAKEGVRIEGETQTFATITIQNYFRLYEKLAGMTGTAETEATEFWEIYELDVVKIPTHRPMARRDHNDYIFRTRREKYNAIIEEIARLQQVGRPILVGTTTVEVSETLSRLLKRRGVKHNVLNAKHHQREAEIVSRAGESGAVTIATNMAGRGTDIKLGAGVLPSDGSPGATDESGDMGLAIIGSERHESRRIDRQLRGRSGRQGDPGSTRFFLSLEDDLMRLFRSERVATVMEKLGAEEGEVIEHSWLTRAVENAQKKVEQQNFSIRKRLLEYDDVMNRQREVVYGLRARVIDGESMREEILGYLDGAVETEIEGHVTDPEDPVSEDVIRLIAADIEMLIVAPMSIDALLGERVMLQDVVAHFQEQARDAYTRRENDWGDDITREVERRVMLSIIDEKWRDHLYEMDMLKEGIGFRAYAQKDPLVEYKREGFGAFEIMMGTMGTEVLRRLFRVSVVREGPPGAPQAPQGAAAPRAVERHAAYSAFDQKPVATATSAPPVAREPIRGGKKVGRNDACPCGSGKKYKKCHGTAG